MYLLKISIFVTMTVLTISCVPKIQNCAGLTRGTTDYRLCHAEAGSKEFQYRAGMEAYLLGDMGEGRKWLKRAVKSDTGFKKVKEYSPLDQIYETTQAVKFTEKERGHEGAAFMLAKLHSEGADVRINKEQASLYRGRSKALHIEIEEFADHFNVKNMRITSSAFVDSNLKRSMFELYSFNVMKSPSL